MDQDTPKHPPSNGRLSRLRAVFTSLAVLTLGALSLAPAQAQIFRIDPVTPAPFSTSGDGLTAFARADESVQPQFRITCQGGDGGTDYRVNIAIITGNNQLTDPQDGVDFRGNSIPGSVTLRGGASMVVTLRVYDDESFEELPQNRPFFSSDEQLTLTLSSPSGQQNATSPMARLSNGGNEGPTSNVYGIIDNDARPRIRIRDTQVAIADRTDEARFMKRASLRAPLLPRAPLRVRPSRSSL